MKSGRTHKPAPTQVIDELLRAGVSRETANAMERWKAHEVLELLRFRQTEARSHKMSFRP